MVKRNRNEQQKIYRYIKYTDKLNTDNLFQYIDRYYHNNFLDVFFNSQK